MSDPSVTVTDKGYNSIMKALTKKNWSELTVGIHDEEAAMTHSRTGETYGEIADINEWGRGNVPSRSMIRAWVDQNFDKLADDFTRAYAVALKNNLTKQAENAALDKLGKKFARQVQKRIQDVIMPDNAEFTQNRKGFNYPLVETGTLVKLFKHKVIG